MTTVHVHAGIAGMYILNNVIYMTLHMHIDQVVACKVYLSST